MPKQPTAFRYDETVTAEAAAFVASLPSGIDGKDMLLAELARRLQFPDYFGGNWDAVEECIRDLSWLPRGNIVIRHMDLPLSNDGPAAKVYLAILADAVLRPLASQGHRLVVYFPVETREKIIELCEYGGKREGVNL